MSSLELIKVDVEAKKTEYINAFETKSGRTLGTADPARLFMITLAGVVSGLEVSVNDTFAQNFIEYARGGNLDEKGRDILTERLDASSAVTTLQFTLSAALSFAVVIPTGTRATAGDMYVFATDKQLTIPAGSVTGTVTATSTEAGAFANGLVPGQINILVDPVGYVQSVTNTTTTNGGSDAESDENYRGRIRIANESFSTAGPEGAYQYRAKSAHQSIADVSVDMSSPGVVSLYPLLHGGELPTSEILSLVQAACTPKTVRPLTDNVVVAVPERVSYAVNITYFIAESNENLQQMIASAVATAVSEFVTWQGAVLGRNINDSELIRRVIAAGASRVAVVSPSFTVVASNQQAYASSINISYGGTEHD